MSQQSMEPNYGSKQSESAPTETELANEGLPRDGYISREELDRILAERDEKHAAEVAAIRTRVPVAMVPQNAGGPGIDQHQVSWNLAEQEAAARGDILDHWILTE